MSVSKSLLIPLALMALSVSAFADTKSPRSRRGQSAYEYQYGQADGYEAGIYVRPDIKSGADGSTTGHFGGYGDISGVSENIANSNSKSPRGYGSSKQGLKATGEYVYGEIGQNTYAVADDDYYPLENKAYGRGWGSFGAGDPEATGYGNEGKGEFLSEGRSAVNAHSAKTRSKNVGSVWSSRGGYINMGGQAHASSGEKSYKE